MSYYYIIFQNKYQDETDSKPYSPLRRTIFWGKNFVTRHIKFAYSYPHLYWHVYDMLALYLAYKDKTLQGIIDNSARL